MQSYAAVVTIICIMMCFTFSYTFPLRSAISVTDETGAPNVTAEFAIPVHHAHDTIVERSKKMASNIETALKRIRDSTQDFGKNIYNQVNSGLNTAAAYKKPVTEDDIRQYEQLVLIKKYPYLDFKEFDQKLSPSKNTRQSSKFQPESNLGIDPSIWEPTDEDVPNVEITNRGLSGFAIPPQQLSKRVNLDEKMKYVNDKLDDNVKISQKTPEHSVGVGVLGKLKDQLIGYVSHKK